MFRSFGWPEILLILGVLVLVFGAARLPQMGLSLGKGLREFKRGITNGDGDQAKIASDAKSPSEPSERPPVQH